MKWIVVILIFEALATLACLGLASRQSYLAMSNGEASTAVLLLISGCVLAAVTVGTLFGWAIYAGSR